MRRLTTITRTTAEPLPGITLLWHPVTLVSAAGQETTRAPERSLPVGRVRGVIVDDARRVQYFVVALEGHGRSVAVPLSAVEVGRGEIQLLWTEAQLRAQPSMVSDALLPRGRFDGAPPARAQWMPARPSVVPPGLGGDRAGAERGALIGGALGVGVGALVGLAAGGLPLALGVALFFGAGGGVAGALAGGSRETATDASEFEESARVTSGGTWRVNELERALRDRAHYLSGALVMNDLAVEHELNAVLTGHEGGGRRDAEVRR
jgi:hypothetical protein